MKVGERVTHCLFLVADRPGLEDPQGRDSVPVTRPTPDHHVNSISCLLYLHLIQASRVDGAQRWVEGVAARDPTPVHPGGLEMKREDTRHLVPAPAVRLIKRRVLSRPGINSP